MAVALADKIDTLVGFWVIDETPTGSADPFALRRAALGVIRLILNNNLRVHLFSLFISHGVQVRRQIEDPTIPLSLEIYKDVGEDFSHVLVSLNELKKSAQIHRKNREQFSVTRQVAFSAGELLIYFAERLKGQLRDDGARHDLVDAVFELGGQDDLFLIVRRVEALGKFLDTEDGRNLLAGYRRAANIIRIEEKRDGLEYIGKPDRDLYQPEEEKALAEAITAAKSDAERGVSPPRTSKPL